MAKRISSDRRRRFIVAWGMVCLAAAFAFAGYQGAVSVAGRATPGVAQEAATPTPPDPPQMEFHRGEVAGGFTSLDSVPEGAEIVTVGVYIKNVYDLSVVSNTYYMSGYLWMRWTGDFDPVAGFEFANAVDSWGLTSEPLLDEPRVLPDGSNYQALHFQGRFYEPFDLRDYPLDKQQLLLYLENSTDTVDKVVYVPDTASSAFDASLLVPGWNITALKGQALVHNYGTDFGEIGVDAASEYATVKFSLELERLISRFIGKLLLPLMVVLLTNWLALLLNPTWVEVRTAMPATALLTLAFLQQASLDAIPQVSTLVLMDKFYIMAYACVVATLVQIIWINYNIKPEDPENVAHMRRIDARSLVAQVIVFTMLFGYLLITTLNSPTNVN